MSGQVWCPGGLGRRRQGVRKFEPEHRPLAKFGFYPKSTVGEFDNLADEGETETRAFTALSSSDLCLDVRRKQSVATR